jgi:hypothetical protein
MKYLFYTTYCSGRTGLSNSIMSTELGVLLAFLTDRVLVLDGNLSPPANLVAYDGKLSNRHRSRPTDLIELPVPWLEAEQIDSEGRGPSMELTDRSLVESVFFYPASLDLDSEDFRRFAQGRRAAFTYGGEYRDAAVLRLSGGPEIGDNRYKMHNLGFYAPFLYLDTASKEQVHRLLRAMHPKRHIVELADRATAALGTFNAVHIRRGDFKRTYGRTTLLRRPREAIEVLDHNFSRRDRLVILTDEGDDPFFAEIVQAYPHTVLLDRFILDELDQEFRDLPHHDSVALAFLCQLIAVRARDFVGTMTSTFSALIQRWRGSRGLDERFKFLWNEIPAADAAILRGATAINRCVPMRPDGTMVEEFEGPYSWNRYDPRINSAWMREWPESFLPPSDLAAPLAGGAPAERARNDAG